MTKNGFISLICGIVVFGPFILLLLLYIWIRSKIKRKKQHAEIQQILKEDEELKQRFTKDPCFEAYCEAHDIRCLNEEEKSIFKNSSN